VLFASAPKHQRSLFFSSPLRGVCMRCIPLLSRADRFHKCPARRDRKSGRGPSLSFGVQIDAVLILQQLDHCLMSLLCCSGKRQPVCSILGVQIDAVLVEQQLAHGSVLAFGMYLAQDTSTSIRVLTPKTTSPPTLYTALPPTSLPPATQQQGDTYSTVPVCPQCRPPPQSRFRPPRDLTQTSASSDVR